MGKTVEVYDPERKAVVEVPAEQEAQLAAAGYKTGPEAGLEERMNGWEGTLAAALMGAGRKASFGAMDAYVPASLKSVQRHVEELHPIAKELGGMPALMARQGLLAAAGGPLTAILGAGAAGGMEAATEAAKYQHPIQAERMVQGALWSAAMEGLGQGVGAAFKYAAPAGRAALRRLAAALPRETEIVTESLGAAPQIGKESITETIPAAKSWGTSTPEEPSIGDTTKTRMADVFKDPRGQPVIGKGYKTSTLGKGASLEDLAAEEGLPPPLPGYRLPQAALPEFTQDVVKVGKYARPLSAKAEALMAAGLFTPARPAAAAILAANRGIPAALNRLDLVNSAFGEVVQKPMEIMGQVVKNLVRGGGDILSALHTRDVDKEYAAATEAVGRAANDPMALHDTLDAQYGHVFEDHPMVYGQASAQIATGAAVLNSLLPRNPNELALTGNTVDPPRSMKVKWLHLFHGAGNPAALADPYPELIEVYKQMHPETLRMVQQALLTELQDPKVAKSLTTAQARKISIILEQPVRTETSQAFIARLQKTATASSQQKQQTQASGRPAPAQVVNQVSTMDAPEMLQRQLGPQ